MTLLETTKQFYENLEKRLFKDDMEFIKEIDKFMEEYEADYKLAMKLAMDMKMKIIKKYTDDLSKGNS